MATQTLLDMTQEILSAMSSDEVNSISDTAESLQVATIIKRKYYDILARGHLPQDDDLVQLNPSDDPTKPILMYIPAGVTKIKWIKYFDSNPQDSQQVSQFGSFSHDLNTDIVQTPPWTTTSTTSVTAQTGTATFTVASATLPIFISQTVTAVALGGPTMTGTILSYSGTTLVMNVVSTSGGGTFANWTLTGGPAIPFPGFKYVTILPIEQFLEQINQFNPTDPDVRSYQFVENGKSFTFYYKNDHQPSFCTIISNEFVLFDTFDNTQDSTLQASKTMCSGQYINPFQMVDTFIPNLQDNQFPLLVNEAKALAFYELKQQPHAKAEQELKRQWSVTLKNKSMVNRPTYFDELANFGRTPNTGGYGGRIRRSNVLQS